MKYYLKKFLFLFVYVIMMDIVSFGAISIQTEYGGRLEKGTYRLVAPCSLSADPDAAGEASAVDLAAEFEIG